MGDITFCAMAFAMGWVLCTLIKACAEVRLREMEEEADRRRDAEERRLWAITRAPVHGLQGHGLQGHGLHPRHGPGEDSKS